jgi:6-phosphogluconolactonase
MSNFEIKKFSNDSELAQTAANLWLDSVFKNPRQSVALSGGGIARLFFREIAKRLVARKISFTEVDFFWADERCVPPTDPESNFALANEFLFTSLKISLDKIHRLRGELEPAAAVAEANSEIFKIVPQRNQGQPMLDFVFLGLGPDGHVASLFPNASAEVVNCKTPFLHIENSPKPPPKRISLSYAAIIAAKEVWVLASGKGKENALAESLSTDGQTPLARVLKSRTQTRIFSDIYMP